MLINAANLSAIYKSFSTIFNEQLALVLTKAMWPLVAMEVPSTGESTDYPWLGAFPSMKEWVGERAVKDLEAFQYTIRNKNFEATVSVDRNKIEDDQVGVYKPLIQGLAHSAAIHPDQLVWSLLKAGFAGLCYDGQYFFDTDHPVGDSTASNSGGGSGTGWYLLDLSRPIKPLVLQTRRKPEFVSMDDPANDNVFRRREYLYGVDDRKNVGYGLWQLAYGSKQTLDAANYAAARTAMASLTNEEGQPMGIVPTHLVVPNSLEASARAVVKAETLTAGGSNIWFNTAELVVVPWL